MTIKVKEEDDGTFTISWDANDPKESIFNTYTQEDFVRVISEYLEKIINDNDGKV